MSLQSKWLFTKLTSDFLSVGLHHYFNTASQFNLIFLKSVWWKGLLSGKALPDCQTDLNPSDSIQSELLIQFIKSAQFSDYINCLPVISPKWTFAQHRPGTFPTAPYSISLVSNCVKQVSFSLWFFPHPPSSLSF